MTCKEAFPTALFIGGKWRPGHGAPIAVENPSDGKEIARIQNATVDDAMEALAAADAAADWARTPSRERGEILRRCYEVMVRDAERLARLISLENGKALKDAAGEVAYAAEFFRWFSEEAVRGVGDLYTSPNGSSRILVQYQPIGISLMITPWNFPAAMATRKIAPALAAGCTCILKPASETPLTALAVAELMAEAGVPAGVVNVICTSDTERVVDALLEEPRVRKLSFTGSTRVGRILLKKAAEQVIHCSMELGGNAPFIVFDDADLDKAVEGAMVAKMRNGGQACTAANRFYVQKGIYDRFAEKFTRCMNALVVGAGTDPATDCGPVVSDVALRKISGLVEGAQALGAEILCGGRILDREGYFYPPTVLGRVSAKAEIAHQEIFGPVAPLYCFEDEEEVVRLANDTEYGLVSYVFTQDMARGLRIAGRLEAGMLALNRGLVSDPAAPFGGVKQSGLGREGAHHGMLEFMEAKYISTTW